LNDDTKFQITFLGGFAGIWLLVGGATYLIEEIIGQLK